MRAFDRDLIRGGHYGQRSCEPHQQAEHMAAPTNAAFVKKVLANSEPSTHGPSVWTGRALQVENDDLEKLVLRFCIRPIDGAFELLAIMDIRARSISFATRPRRPEGPPDHERAGETFSPSPLSDSQTSAGKPTLAFGISLSRQPSPW
jgi:hypothetical protein